MFKRKSLVISGLLVLGVLAVQAQERPPGPGEPPAVTGQIVSVTAYRGQAMVSRSVPVRRGTGLMDIVVKDLPAFVYGGSLFADGGANVEVRAVRYRTRVVGRDVSDEVAKLQLELEDIAMRKRENVALTQLADRQLQFLDKLDNFVAPTVTVEINKGVLNAEQLEKLSKFSFEKRAELVKARLALVEGMIKLSREEQLAQMKLNQLGGGDTRIEREAVIFVDKRADADASVTLSYLVGNVNWMPNYNLRAEAGKDAIRVEYSALVTQMSGEDWNGVALTLSTASPALVARGAILAPMVISLAPRGASSPGAAYAARDVEVWNKTRADLKKSQMDTARVGRPNADDYGPPGPADPAIERAANKEMEDQLNRIADEMQKFEFYTSGDVIRHQRTVAEGISVEYRLPGSTGLASRADQQLVKIADLNLAAKFAFVGTPIHSDYVYLEGEARNTSEVVLLEGQYTAYLDGRFVGRSFIPLVGRGENFTAGFGIDSQLRVGRDLVSKEDTIKGGNRVVTYNYRLTLVNYRNTDVEIRLMDRMPTTQADIRINLIKTSEELSKDRLYVRDQKPKGILRWDVKVPKGATEADAKEVTYSFSMEYDKQMELSSK